MSKAFSVTTIYDQYLTLVQKFQLPFEPAPNTTLNDKFGINYALPPASGYPTIKYLAIGNGGHVTVTGNNYINGLLHSCTDSALKNQLPFLIVPENNDLSSVEMGKYRIRKPMIINGMAYVAYYLKVIEFPPMSVDFSTYQLANGNVINQTSYTPTLATQHPTMIDPSNTSLNLVSGNHISTSINTAISLTVEDIQGIIDACVLLYGTANAAIISEMALVAGFDISAPITVAGVNTSYTEIQCAQVTNFISALYPTSGNSNPSIVEGLDFGMTQPLLLVI
jgi:hypothetical protein